MARYQGAAPGGERNHRLQFPDLEVNKRTKEEIWKMGWPDRYWVLLSLLVRADS